MFGQKFYFSYGTDITLTQQRWVSIYGDSRATNKPMWANADKRFWWNRFLTQMFTGDACLLVCRCLPALNLCSYNDEAIVQERVQHLAVKELAIHLLDLLSGCQSVGSVQCLKCVALRM